MDHSPTPESRAPARDVAIDATGRIPAAGERALVLGGGGSTGHAWLAGVLAGLVDAGLDVTDADLVVGTSAGATVAAQLDGSALPGLYASALAPVPAPQARPASGGLHSAGQVSSRLRRISEMTSAATDLAELRRMVGAAALELLAESDGSWQPRWRATVAARIGDGGWPQRTVVLTAVDAATGEPVVFDRHSGVELVDAVAASCSSALPYRIGDRHFIDGGYRANAENADLAAGYRRVLVLSPFGGRALTPVEWGTHLATQVEALREGGSSVEVIAPERDSEHLFGPNAMDVSLRPAAASAGHAQGTALAGDLAELWR